MDPNKCSHGKDQAPGHPDQMAALATDIDALADQDRDRLTDPALAHQIQQLRRLLDRLKGHWLGALAALDARGAAGADHRV